jgi:putative membrane protein
MERRLLKAIATPAMLVTLLVGLALATAQGPVGRRLAAGQLALVLGMVACHGVLARHVRLFAADGRPRPARWYRVFNEAPTLLFLGIVVLAIVKPF